MKTVMLTLAATIIVASVPFAATIVPTEIEQPGTQPLEIGNLESPDRCDNCHGGYDPSVEPAFNWRGSMMANAGRDPIFWATLAIAEKDFPGAGDLCLRCHAPSGWLAGRSTPTDGSALQAGDADGVECDTCHKIVNPDDSEYAGVQSSPYLANDEATPATGYYGSGMAVYWGGNDKLGPYPDAAARHQFLASLFHRSQDFCGTCHDVSNPAVGDLAPSHGAQPTADPVIASGTLGSPVDGKAAFNNFPFQYGVVERTYSEFRSGRLSTLPVSSYPTLPAEMQAGALEAAWESATVAGTGGDYADGTERTFTCQTCHLRPVQGAGCNKKGVAGRSDLPLHDMTGGNYWMPDAIRYLDGVGGLRLGGGLDTTQLAALESGKTRALKQLHEAANLVVDGDAVRVVNLTGHKLISGYPEGRRMWLHVTWYDAGGAVVREDGAYGPLPVLLDGVWTTVDTLYQLHDPNTRVYEAHYGMSQAWAAKLVGEYGFDSALPLAYDRVTGGVTATLGDLAAAAPGSTLDTFHFVLNDVVTTDNRIPPYQMSYDEARRRNALPVPADQYGNPGPGGAYSNVDVVSLDPPSAAVWAEIELLYQPTSWEYVQFLYLDNDGANPFLADEGARLLEAWQATGMAAPYTMAEATWGTPPTPAEPLVLIDALSTWSVDRNGNLQAASSVFRSGDTVALVAHVADGLGAPLSGAQVFAEISDAGGAVVKSMQGFSDTQGQAVLRWKTGRKETTGVYTVTVIDTLLSGYTWSPEGSTVSVSFTLE